MKKYIMDIKLLSDLCVSDGGVYNSAIDTDACYDKQGLPYIPARRIKGCLKECADELNDWGIAIPTEKLFGRGGNQPGTVRIGNARLADFHSYRETLLQNAGSVVTHPQNVLREFSYIRTQTSIDYETGTAKDHSLRMMRVVKRGLHFEAEVVMQECDFSSVEKCCTIMNHMGMARTRGFGEIAVTLREKEENALPKNLPAIKESCPWVDGSTRLDYELTLMEPVLCKNRSGEEKTDDYIDGSKILGLIAQASRKEGEDSFLKLMEKGELICSNAYPEANGQRLTPVSACYYSIKNVKTYYVDKTSTEYQPASETRHMNKMKHCYVAETTDKKLLCQNPEVEERYHHRRPEDKSIGRAIGGEIGNGVLYQISSISAGQKFRGYIEGNTEQIKKVYHYLKNQEMVRIGAGRSAEYGSVRLAITGLRREREEQQECLVNDFIVKMESPLILYGDHAAYTTDSDILIQEINCYLGLKSEQIQSVERYIGTVTVGGYNVTWGMRKPMIEAFDMGSVLHYKLMEPVDISHFSHLWVGERVSEGFGEVTVKKAAAGNGERQIYRAAEENENRMLNVSDSEFLSRLCVQLFNDYIDAKAIELADKDNTYWKSREATNPTVSIMLLMCSELEKFDDVQIACEKRFNEDTWNREDKWEISQKILGDSSERAKNLLKEFEKDCQINGYVCPNERISKRFLETYLQEIRYILRQEKGGDRG